MMNLKYLLTFFTFISIYSFSQPVINYVAPAAGTIKSMRDCDWNRDPGPSGPNQIWDFSNLVTTSSFDYMYWVASTGPEAQLFPNANIGLSTSSNQRYYYDYNGSSANLVGQVQSPISVVLDNYFEFIEFPATYLDTWLDTNQGFQTPLVLFHSGISSMYADGYGTLILPNATYYDVLRVRSISNQLVIDTSTSDTILNHINLSYQFYIDGVVEPVLDLRDPDTTNIGNEVARYQVDPFLSLDETEKEDFSLYPNPTNGLLNIKFSGDMKTNFKIEICDIHGRVLKTFKEYVKSLDLTPYQSGIYFIIFKNGNRLLRKRIIKK